MDQIVNRLDRVEKKLDEIGRAMVEIAKTEERVVRLIEENQEFNRCLHKIQERVASLEKDNIKNGQFSRSIERAIWIMFTAAIGFVSATIGKLFN